MQIHSLYISLQILFAFLLTVQPVHAESNKHSMDALLDLPLKELMNIEIVTAGKTAEKIKDIPASVVLITRNDIEKYGFSTLTDILENAPGLYNIYSYAGVSGNFGVRGFWNPNSQNSNVAILVNGISQVYDKDRTHPLDKINVPVESIDRIEIIRGPMAVLYGNGASFGVINIITNEVRDENRQSLASISYGSLDTKKAVYRLAAKENDLKFVINAAHYQSAGLDHKFNEMMSPANVASLPALGVTNPEYSTKDLLDQESKYFALSGSYNNWIFDLAYNETRVGLFLLVPPLGEGYHRSSKNTSMMLGYQSSISEKIDVDIWASYNSNSRADLAELLVAGIENSEVIDSNSFEFEMLSTITPSDKSNIIVGINYRNMSDLRDVIDGPSVGIINESFEINDRKTAALFTQVTYQAMDKLNLVAGIRYEDLFSYETFGITNGGLPGQSTFGDTRGDIQNTSHRLAAIYSFNEQSVIKFLYGEANRLGDDILDAEITRTAEINYIYSENNFFSSLSFFQNRLEDLVIKDLVFEGGSLVSKELNGGEVTTNGVEFIIRNDLTTNLYGEFSMTMQESVNEVDKSIDVAYSPKSVVHASLSYRKNYTTLAILGRYIGSMEPLYDLVLDARVGEKVDAYAVMDLNVRQDNFYKDMYLNFKISNVLDEQVRYANNQETNELLDFGTLGAERQYIATIGVKF